MEVDLEAVLNEAGRRGLLRDGEFYSKRMLLEAFSRIGLGCQVVDRALGLIRDVVKTGHGTRDMGIGDVGIQAIGERKGREYSFRGLAELGTPSTKAVARSMPLECVAAPSQSLPVCDQVATTQGLGQMDLGQVDIHFGDNLPILQGLETASFDLIYIDPPFNTGKVQAMTRIKTVRDQDGGDRTGFQGNRYRTMRVGTASFADSFDDFFEFLEPRLEEAKRLLKPSGSFFLHIDYREVHYCKVLLDEIFGRDAFINEIIWAYDYGGRSKKKWSAKHDNILWYVRDSQSYTFNFDEMDRIPYMAPGLVGKEKAARGKTPTDVWWHTIVPTNGKERTGYPTQKPLGILNRILKVHSRPGDRVLDFFGGSGTTGEASARLGRACTLIDNNVEAINVMARRLAFAEPIFHGCEESPTTVDDLPVVPDGLDPVGGESSSARPVDTELQDVVEQQNLFD